LSLTASNQARFKEKAAKKASRSRFHTPTAKIRINRKTNDMRIGVIASMKKGLEHFVYRELTSFAAAGLAITIFPTKLRPGLYNARPEWKLLRWKAWIVILLQPYFVFQGRIKYLRLFWEAVSIGAVADFALACHFSSHMADVDVIYATFADRKLFVGYFCKKLLDKPLIVTIHAYELYQNPNSRLFTRALACCDQIITVTEYNRDYLACRYGIQGAEVVRCGVDTDEYRPEHKFVILIVGFFVERKGHEILFKAIKQLEQDDIEVWVVGDEGAETPTVDVTAMAKRQEVEDKVVFFGKLSGNALKAVYRTCDIFCLPCRTDSQGVAEGFPVALMEAMAFGKPVVTTRHVEIPKIIKEIVVDENDVAGLAGAIRQVYLSESLRERLGTNNRIIAEQVFSTRNASKAIELVRRVAEQKRAEQLSVPAAILKEASAQDASRV
jgi:colanic acid/amylovoran biosynthesis glycosyltransferase